MSLSPGSIAARSSSSERQPSCKELVEKINKSLVSIFRKLASVNSDITLYQLYWNTNEDIRRDPSDWNKLDDAYSAYEEQSNNCRRLWMKLRATAEREALRTKAIGGSSTSGFHPLARSPSPLEYQSEEEGKIKAGSEDQVKRMVVDPVQVKRDIARPPTPATNPPPPRPRPRGDAASTSRAPIITPGGQTSRRLAPIPKGVNLSVETTRIPVPAKPYTFNMPRNYVVNDSERRPLNRSKRNHPNTRSSPLASSSSSQSTIQHADASTTQTSFSLSPKSNYSSAREYWKPCRPIRSGDFCMDEDRRANSLDCLGPPFQVNMREVTHNAFPGTLSDLRSIYGIGPSLTPKVSPEGLSKHGFRHWMVLNVEFHPLLPPRPGWPGLMIQLDDELEEWQPEGGSEFRVIIKKDPRSVEYVGQYELVRLGDITGDEWKKQHSKVKNRWTQVLGSGQLWKEAVARVALRKDLGKEPSMDEFGRYTKKLTAEKYAMLAKDLKDDVDKALCKGEEVIAVWGMRCVGYDFKFEKHLARSLRAIKPPSPGSSKKRKVFTRNSSAMSDGEDERTRADSDSGDPSPSKRQRVAKGKAKLVRYDWSGAKFHGDSEDDDYRPASS